MFTCDYQDLVNPQKKTKEEAKPFIGSFSIEGVEVDTKRSFREAYASSPEPPIPVWITYHWIVFRAKSSTAKLTVSDWDPAQQGNDHRSARSKRSISWNSNLITSEASKKALR